MAQFPEFCGQRDATALRALTRQTSWATDAKITVPTSALSRRFSTKLTRTAASPRLLVSRYLRTRACSDAKVIAGTCIEPPTLSSGCRKRCTGMSRERPERPPAETAERTLPETSVRTRLPVDEQCALGWAVQRSARCDDAAEGIDGYWDDSVIDVDGASILGPKCASGIDWILN